mmetsp:Transcript_2537/g.7226  ORF Transcript_2537/g.7226 Transcript_2537/m.7226 type:complete len:201 (+) Transcript_2537:1437-2039(+)
MEEGDPEQKLVPQTRLCARVPHDIRDSCPRALQVGPNALRGLKGHLDGVLQNWHGEVAHRHGGKPQAEVVMDIVRVGEGLNHLLELGHPRLGQVTVGENHPVARSACLLDELVCDRALALSERDGVRARVVVSLRSEAQDGGHGVRSSGKHEDEWRGLGGVRKYLVEVEGRVLHVLHAHLLSHKIGACEHEFLYPEHSCD